MNYKVHDKVMASVNGDLIKYININDIGEIYAVCYNCSIEPYNKVMFGHKLLYAKASDITMCKKVSLM